MNRITADTAKSLMRVHLAKALASMVVEIFSLLDEEDTALTEHQQTSIVAVALMGYRDHAEQAEESVDDDVEITVPLTGARRAKMVDLVDLAFGMDGPVLVEVEDENLEWATATDAEIEREMRIRNGDEPEHDD